MTRSRFEVRDVVPVYARRARVGDRPHRVLPDKRAADVSVMSRDLSDRELIEALRRAASIWFKNDDLLLLEELIRRYRKWEPESNIGQDQ